MKKGNNKYKLTEAVSIVSHQLKTPLSAIKGYLEVLLSGDFGELNRDQAEYLNDVLDNTKHMISLVTDLLDVTRIEANQIELKIRPTNLNEITQELIAEFSPLARAKNCQLFFESSEVIGQIEADPVKIKEVMANLIVNAINYNVRKGQVKVTLTKKGKDIIFCCQDTGMGIAKKDKGKVFSKFYRSEKAMSKATSGSGLGLFISKAMVEKMRGKIWFQSEENKGSTFCFSLPIKK